MAPSPYPTFGHPPTEADHHVEHHAPIVNHDERTAPPNGHPQQTNGQNKSWMAKPPPATGRIFMTHSMILPVFRAAPPEVAGITSALAQEMESTPQWTWNDGWILMATYLSHESDGARLQDLIAAADGINHAIPTGKELSRAFTKFVRIEIVEIADDRFRLKAEFLPQIEKAYNGHGGLFESAKKGERWLKTLDVTQANRQDVVITDDEVSIAYNEYTSAIKRRSG